MDLASKQAHASRDHFAGFNCCQSVLLQYAEDYGLDRDRAALLASGFGGGMVIGKTCGAVTGAIMVLGLAYGFKTGGDLSSKDQLKQLVRAFIEAFRTEHEDTDCHELLGMDITIAENRELMKQRGMSQSHCDRYITDSIRILEEIMGSRR